MLRRLIKGCELSSCLLVLTLLGTASAEGQTGAPVGFPPGTPASSVVRQQIDLIYRQAAAAKNLEEIGQALAAAQQIKPQDLKTRDYLLNLTAWMHNRRGEMFTEMASVQTKGGNSTDAARFEAQAIAEFSSAIQMHPNSRAFHNRGVSYATEGKYEQALQDFTKCLQQNPNDLNARFNRAELNLELGNYEQAEQDYSMLLTAQPNDSAALVGRAHVRFYIGKFEDSLLDFDDAIARDPSNALAYADRADLYAYLGRWEEAARDYRTAIRIDNNLGRAYQSAAWLMATCPEDRFRDPQLALRAAKRAIDLEGSRDYRYMDTLAAAQANANLFPQAQQTMQDALRSAPAEVVPELEQRLTLYSANRPYRDVPQ